MNKFILIILLFFKISFLEASTNIAYLDVQYIIDNSNLGKFYKNKIDQMRSEAKLKIQPQENEIKKMENEIKNKQNILKKEEIDNKVKILNKKLKEYQLSLNDLNKNIISKKKFYSTEVLKILNPILTNYVDKNNISLVIQKKNILVGVKSLDITGKILNIVNEETIKQKLINEN